MKFIDFLINENNQFTPPNQTGNDVITIPGIGTMTLDVLRGHVVSMLNDIAKRAQGQNVDWESVLWMVKDSELQTYITALINNQ